MGGDSGKKAVIVPLKSRFELGKKMGLENNMNKTTRGELSYLKRWECIG